MTMLIMLLVLLLTVVVLMDGCKWNADAYGVFGFVTTSRVNHHGDHKHHHRHHHHHRDRPGLLVLNRPRIVHNNGWNAKPSCLSSSTSSHNNNHYGWSSSVLSSHSNPISGRTTTTTTTTALSAASSSPSPPPPPPPSSSSSSSSSFNRNNKTNRRRPRRVLDIFLPNNNDYSNDGDSSLRRRRRRQRQIQDADEVRSNMMEEYEYKYDDYEEDEEDDDEKFVVLSDADVLLAGTDKLKSKVLVHERDFFRQVTRIQAWDSYVLVSVLCTSISYGALQSFNLNQDHVGILFYELYVETAIHVVAGMAVMTGLYTTMVFSLSILYCRTALGLERDPQYDAFLQNTEQIRINAFLCFSVSLLSFAVLVVLVLSEDLPFVMHLPVGGAMIFALYLGIRDWRVLVGEAADIYDFID